MSGTNHWLFCGKRKRMSVVERFKGGPEDFAALRKYTWRRSGA
jgi:hypothetical protein